MAHKRRMFIIGALAVIAVAMAGVGYALYTAQISNTDNTTTETYIIVSPWDSSAYAGAFDAEIMYNTVNNAGTVTYSLYEGQTVEIDVNGPVSVVPLGDLFINVDQTGTVRDYTVSLSNTAGTMTGTFYVGYAYSEDGITFSSYSYKEYGEDSAVISGSNEYVKIGLFVGSSFQPDDNDSPVKPLDGVTFNITVTATD